MQLIPDDILERFNAAMEQKSVPSTLRDDYRKWLLHVVPEHEFHGVGVEVVLPL
jgi:hypothetical protein